MSETILDSLVVKLRADTSGLETALGSLEQDLGSLEGATSRVTEGMSRAFDGFVRNGEISFESLRKTALSALDDIFSRMLETSLGGIVGNGSADIASFGGIVQSFLFGRAGGGAVAPNRPYLVGEKGPELFMPHSPGRIMPGGAVQGNAATRVTNITVNVRGGDSSPRESRKSAGQIAVAVRRAMEKAERNL
jgi:hypothetical protein